MALSPDPDTIFTIGHSTRPLEEFVELLREAGVRRLVDVRSIPRSRTNPQYNLDTLPASLEPYQIGHTIIAELGGRRSRQQDVPAEVNGYWTNQSFHNYADYALSDPFRSGLEQLVELQREAPCAIMCAEAVWWRCHRRIIADYLLAAGRPVVHIMGPGKLEPAKMTPAAVRDGEALVYPAPDDASGG